MKVAYADPPYIGCAKKYQEKQEVDHRELVERLCRDYDNWALSASSPSLKQILSYCPEDVRVAAWVKPFAIFKPNVNPAYAWEPVIFRIKENRLTRKEPTIRDWVSANITLKKGLVGAKPPDFCYWLFDLLQVKLDDEFCDLYPGTGIVTRCWEEWQRTKLNEKLQLNMGLIEN